MKAKKLLITALATGTLAAGLAAPAQAAALYDGGGYRDHLGTWTHGTHYVGDNANDKASSISINGRHTRLYADVNYVGPSALITHDWNDLRDLHTGLAWWQTWDNRISSFSK